MFQTLVLRRKKGFTLIELLVVIGIIAILAAVVLIAINPGRQFAQSRNAQRSSDVEAILNACHQWGVDHNGNLNVGGLLPVGTPVLASALKGTDVAPILVPTHITAIPADPKITAPGTDYTVTRTTVGGTDRLTVTASSTEVPPAAAVISVMR